MIKNRTIYQVSTGSNLLSFHFQMKDSNMHVYAYSWLLNNDDRNQQNNHLLAPFLL